MGAVTALMHADRDPSIAALVLDSPFTSLKTLAEELAKTYAKVLRHLNLVHTIVFVVSGNQLDQKHRLVEG